MSRNPFKQKAFEKMSVIEHQIEKRLAHLQYVNGVAVNSEDDLCIACVRWFDQIFPEREFDLIHIANEGKRTRWEGMRNKRMGVRAGVPDYIVFKNGHFIGWMEFKFGDNNATFAQRQFREMCEKNDIKYAEIRTFQEFKDTLQDWGIYNPLTDKVPFFKNLNGCQISKSEAEKLFKKTGLKINNEDVALGPGLKASSPFKDQKV